MRRRVALALIALQLIGVPQSFAAIASPRPTPKVTPVKKVIPKKKIVVKKKSVVKKKVVAKPKAVVHHYVYHRRVAKPVPPSPSPTWPPPKGFTSLGFAYARIPTGAELVGILSAAKKPAAAIQSCASDPAHPRTPAYSCAAVLVATSQRCTWWKITSTVTGIDPANPAHRTTLGEITTYELGAAAKKIQTIFLISPIPLKTGVKFTSIHALCGIGPATDPVPGTTFTATPIPIATPTDIASPTPSP